jgi:lipopolysaccharide/colanic/teichoic acid biosynthesis glycosyltransferase
MMINEQAAAFGLQNPRDLLAYYAIIQNDEAAGRAIRRLSDAEFSRYSKYKRAADILISAVLIAFLLPVILSAVLAVKASSPGPAFFLQQRFGLDGRSFLIFKLRTMHVGNGDASGREPARRRDGRVTPLGRWLRRLSIDELPQLFNVLKGDMSLVGPRAHPTALSVSGRMPTAFVTHYHTRHVVRPGITGWAQINGSRGLLDSGFDVERRTALDLYYISHMNFSTDMKILLKTALAVLKPGTAF